MQGHLQYIDVAVSYQNPDLFVVGVLSTFLPAAGNIANLCKKFAIFPNICKKSKKEAVT